MFIYGSILIAVTFNPVVLRSRPVEEATSTDSETTGPGKDLGIPITPFPIPLMTPPETRMYFVIPKSPNGGGGRMKEDATRQVTALTWESQKFS
jgi:hypothetical protein